MWCGGGEIGVAFITEDTKVLICWRGSKQSLMWGGVVECLGWEDIQQVSCGMEGFNPGGGWSERLKQKRANNVVGSTNYALNFTVLGGGVEARHA